MITEEHLRHWLGEIEYALDGIYTEVQSDKVECLGTTVSNGKFVSFEYIREKSTTILGLIHCVRDDMITDK